MGASILLLSKYIMHHRYKLCCNCYLKVSHVVSVSLCSGKRSSFKFIWILCLVVPNLVKIYAVVSITWNFQYFARLAWKRLFTPPKYGFWGHFTRKLRSSINVVFFDSQCTSVGTKKGNYVCYPMAPFWWQWHTQVRWPCVSRFVRLVSARGVTMGWLLRLVTGAPLVAGGPDSSRVLSD